MPKKRPIKDRFFEKVELVPFHTCWEWTGSKDHGGYGRIYLEPQNRKASRVSWEIHSGPIPNGLFVLHKCDNRGCVNPDHLFLGTSKDNHIDMVKKNRDFKPIGEKHPLTKFTNEDVRNIRTLHHKLTIKTIAHYYEVTEACIKDILYKKRWKHL